MQPNRAGEWTSAIRVGDGSPLGRQIVSAACLPPPFNYVGALDYPSVAVVVDTFRGLRVAPASASAGSSITVTPTAPCNSGFPAGIQVEVTTSPGNLYLQKLTKVVFAESNLDTKGNWTQGLVLPASTPPGTYYVDAVCAGPSRSFNAFYAPASIEVLAANATSSSPAGSKIPQTR